MANITSIKTAMSVLGAMPLPPQSTDFMRQFMTWHSALVDTLTTCCEPKTEVVGEIITNTTLQKIVESYESALSTVLAKKGLTLSPTELLKLFEFVKSQPLEKIFISLQQTLTKNSKSFRFNDALPRPVLRIPNHPFVEIVKTKSYPEEQLDALILYILHNQQYDVKNTTLEALLVQRYHQLTDKNEFRKLRVRYLLALDINASKYDTQQSALKFQLETIGGVAFEYADLKTYATAEERIAFLAKFFHCIDLYDDPVQKGPTLRVFIETLPRDEFIQLMTAYAKLCPNQLLSYELNGFFNRIFDKLALSSNDFQTFTSEHFGALLNGFPKAAEQCNPYKKNLLTRLGEATRLELTALFEKIARPTTVTLTKADLAPAEIIYNLIVDNDYILSKPNTLIALLSSRTMLDLLTQKKNDKVIDASKFFANLTGAILSLAESDMSTLLKNCPLSAFSFLKNANIQKKIIASRLLSVEYIKRKFEASQSHTFLKEHAKTMTVEEYYTILVLDKPLKLDQPLEELQTELVRGFKERLAEYARGNRGQINASQNSQKKSEENSNKLIFLNEIGRLLTQAQGNTQSRSVILDIILNCDFFLSAKHAFLLCISPSIIASPVILGEIIYKILHHKNLLGLFGADLKTIFSNADSTRTITDFNFLTNAIEIDESILETLLTSCEELKQTIKFTRINSVKIIKRCRNPDILNEILLDNQQLLQEDFITFFKDESAYPRDTMDLMLRLISAFQSVAPELYPLIEFHHMQNHFSAEVINTFIASRRSPDYDVALMPSLFIASRIADIKNGIDRPYTDQNVTLIIRELCKTGLTSAMASNAKLKAFVVSKCNKTIVFDIFADNTLSLDSQTKFIQFLQDNSFTQDNNLLDQSLLINILAYRCNNYDLAKVLVAAAFKKQCTLRSMIAAIHKIAENASQHQAKVNLIMGAFFAATNAQQVLEILQLRSVSPDPSNPNVCQQLTALQYILNIRHDHAVLERLFHSLKLAHFLFDKYALNDLLRANPELTHELFLKIPVHHLSTRDVLHLLALRPNLSPGLHKHLVQQYCHATRDKTQLQQIFYDISYLRQLNFSDADLNNAAFAVLKVHPLFKALSKNDSYHYPIDNVEYVEDSTTDTIYLTVANFETVQKIKHDGHAIHYHDRRDGSLVVGFNGQIQVYCPPGNRLSH